MDQVHVVRHNVLVEGRTQRAVARELGLSRATVGKYVSQAAPVRKAEAAMVGGGDMGDIIIGIIRLPESIRRSSSK